MVTGDDVRQHPGKPLICGQATTQWAKISKRMGTGTGAALVGRADELYRLRACTRALSEGTGALVLLDGEAGTGKTRLVSEIVRSPFLPKGYASAVAGALDYARAPYAPIRDLLLALDKRFPKVLASNRLLAAALQPVLEFRPPEDAEGDPAEQRRILDAVVQAVGLYAAQSPIVLAIEDVHWIDNASADVLSHLGRAISTMRALLLVSFRPADAQQDQKTQHVLAQLARNATLALSLRPLSNTDSMVLIDDVAPPTLPMDVRRKICGLADGNPLLLIEFTKLAAQDPGALDGSLPLTLKALVNERLAQFDSVDVDVLRVAAAMGEFEPRMLAEIAGIEEPRVFGMLRKARDASIIGEQRSEGAPFIFRHALIRHAVTEGLLAPEAAYLHQRIAERLEQEPASPQIVSRLAHHFYHARVSEKSRHYNGQAAAQALAVFAYSDAIQFIERAIDARPLDESTHSLYKLLAETCAAARRPADGMRASLQLFEYAIRRDDSAEIASNGFDLARHQYQMLDDEGSLATIRRAIDAVDARTHPKEAFNLLATLAWYLAHLRRTSEAAEVLEKADALREYGDERGLVRFFEASGVRKAHDGEVEGYRADLQTALAIAEPLDPHFFVNRLDTAIAIAMASNLDDMEFARGLCQRLWVITETMPVDVVAHTLAMSAHGTFLYGDLENAKRLVLRALPAAEEAPLLSFSIAYTGIPLALHLDDPLLLRRCARPRLLEHAFASVAPNVFGPIAAAVAMQLRSQNRVDEARALLTRAVRRLNDVSNNVHLIVEAARSAAVEALERGMPMLAELKEESRSGAGGWHLAMAYSSSGEERREHAAHAAEIFHTIPWKLYEAEALELAGRAPEALEIYRACGCVADVRRLEASQNARVNTGLSKREYEVALLVAQGRSNKRIADELSLSERTVENHIASIFAKLSLRSRSEIAAYMAREGAG